MRLPAGASTRLDDARNGGGQYHVVVDGSLVHEGQTLPALSCQYATPDEGSVLVRAGTDGVTLLVLRFARPDGPKAARHVPTQ